MDWYDENNIFPTQSIGIDEVGRGPLAGPVVAAAVWISNELITELHCDNLVVRDSKKMTANQRAEVVQWIDSHPHDCIKYAIASASVEEIDSINILNAALLSMKRAHEILNVNANYVLVDGNRSPDISNATVIPVVKGDDKIVSISLASIIAKEYRDKLMKTLSIEYPHYGWDTNVGYGTKKHLAAISMYGVTPHHRKTFAPMKDFKN